MGDKYYVHPCLPESRGPLFHPQSHPIYELIQTWVENTSTTLASLPGGISNASCCFGHRIISIKDEPILTPSEGPVCCFSGWVSYELTDCKEPAITVEIVFSGSVHFVTCCPIGSFINWQLLEPLYFTYIFLVLDAPS